jgi:acetyl esterase/lipase
MRRRSIVLVVSCLLLIASACQIQTLRPEGDSPLRYRDEIFTQVTKTSDVAYGNAVNEQGQNQTLLLDVYQPTGDTVGSRPAIVWVHGGSFRSGSKTSAEIVDEANTFARKGFVNASISYRLSATGCSASSPTANCVNAIFNAKYDAQAAVRFLRANAATYGIDPDRIAIAGTSAGAITALNVAYSPDDPGTSGNPGPSSAVRAAVSLSGAALGTTPNAGEPAVLLFHGTADVVVPYAWATSNVDNAKAAGLQAYLTSWEGLGHVPYVQKRSEILDQTTNFLWWAMQLSRAAR